MASAAQHGARIERPPPYLHCHVRAVKGAWVGRSVLDVFLDVFPSDAAASLGVPPTRAAEAAAAEGRLWVTTSGDHAEAVSVAAFASANPDGVVASGVGVLAHRLRLRQFVRHTVTRRDACLVDGGPIRILRIVRFPSPVTTGERDTVDQGAPTAAASSAAPLSAVVFVDKPASVAVHPCGNCNAWAVTRRLRGGEGVGWVWPTAEAQHGSDPECVGAAEWSRFAAGAGGVLHACHRLDVVTSGVLLLATSVAAAQWVHRAVAGGADEVHDGKRLRGATGGDATDGAPPHSAAAPASALHKMKDYVARVSGRFPDGDGDGLDVVVDTPIGETLAAADGDLRGRFACQAAPADAALRNVKPAVTRCRRLLYDAARDESVVQCQPLTGRTHQIRVHLRHLGHPILLDVAYGGGATDDAFSRVVGVDPLTLEGDAPAVICLHAARYTLPWPDGTAVSVSAPLPHWATPQQMHAARR
jgi:23S rRNA-/tRNA-specific pseudouridylate synthase